MSPAHGNPVTSTGQHDLAPEGATQAAPPGRRSGRLGRWVRIAVGLSLLGFLLTQIDLGQAWRAVADARIDLLLLAFAIVLGSRLLAAARWYLLLRGRHAAVTLPGLLRLMFVADFVGYFMPGSLGSRSCASMAWPRPPPTRRCPQLRSWSNAWWH